MQVARDAVELGRAARAQAKVKVRQPLREAVVVAADREREAIERFEAIVLEELNVKSVRYVSEADELGSFELKPNYRALGPRFGKQMPQVAAAVAALDAAHAARGRHRGDQRRRHGAPALSGRRAAGAPAAGGLPGRALGHPRGGTRPEARRGAAPRGPRPRGGARRAGRTQGRRSQRGGPHRALARGRRRVAGRRPRARGVRDGRDARHLAVTGRTAGRTPPRSRAATCASACSAPSAVRLPVSSATAAASLVASARDADRSRRCGPGRVRPDHRDPARRLRGRLPGAQRARHRRRILRGTRAPDSRARGPCAA